MSAMFRSAVLCSMIPFAMTANRCIAQLPSVSGVAGGDGVAGVPSDQRASGIQKSVFNTTEPHDLFAGPMRQRDQLSPDRTIEPQLLIPPERSGPPEVPGSLEETGAVSIPDFQQSPIISSPLLPPSASTEENGEIHVFGSPEDSEERPSMRRVMHERYDSYRSDQSMWAYLPGDGQDFGWLDWQTEPYLKRGRGFGIPGAINIHWLDGPSSSPLPPRLYDFSLGLQTRSEFSPHLSYDLYTSIGVYSDFEDSARDGIRFPSHAVGMFHLNSSADFIFGVDYLDRGDFTILPVVGVSLRDVFVPGTRMDLVFPRPRIDYLLSDTSRIYLAGRLGGGTWDIEFPDEANHVITYRDYRLLLGFETASRDGSHSSWEFGYVFSRALEFRGIPGNTHFDDAFVIQWVTRR